METVASAPMVIGREQKRCTPEAILQVGRLTGKMRNNIDPVIRTPTLMSRMECTAVMRSVQPLSTRRLGKFLGAKQPRNNSSGRDSISRSRKRGGKRG